MNKSNKEDKFVADGPRRARSGNIDQVRAEVRARHAEAWAKAGFWAKLHLRLRMRNEIRKRLKDFAPDEGLYLKRH